MGDKADLTRKAIEPGLLQDEPQEPWADPASTAATGRPDGPAPPRARPAARSA